MAYTAYVTASEYAALGYSVIPTGARNAYLLEASRNIDSLTFNRIVAKGFDNLTEFQQDLIREACCKHADFLYENKDAIASILDSYAINGVSMHFGNGFNVEVVQGIPVQKTTESLLIQTGLCWRGAI